MKGCISPDTADHDIVRKGEGLPDQSWPELDTEDVAADLKGSLIDFARRVATARTLVEINIAGGILYEVLKDQVGA